MPLKLNGSTSGYVEVAAPAVAGTTSLELPTDSIKPGLVLVAAQSFSAVSSVSVNNCFTTTYDNYVITASWIGSTVTTLSLRVRVSGTDLSSTTYYWTRTSGAGTNATSAQVAAAHGTSDYSSTTVTMFGPALARQTGMTMVTDQTAGYDSYFGSGGVRNTTAYDGFSLIPGSGTITGSLRVYGYRNSL